MTCESTRRAILDHDLGEADRLRLTESLGHLETCAACRAAVGDFDRLRAVMGGDLTAAPEPAPDAVERWAGGADQIEGTADGRADRDGSTRAAVAGGRPAPAAAPPRWPAFAGALAACLAVGLLGLWVGRASYPAPPPAGDVPAPRGLATASGWTPAEAADNATAFEQVSRVFDRRAGWMVVSGQDADVGLAPDDTAPGAGEAGAAARALLLLRLSVYQQDAAVSGVDLVIVPGQTARVRLPFGNGESLDYQVTTSSRDLDAFTLRAQVHAPGDAPGGATSEAFAGVTAGGSAGGAGGAPPGELLAALAARLRLEPGRAASAGQFVTPRGAYELRVASSRAALPGDAPTTAPRKRRL